MPTYIAGTCGQLLKAQLTHLLALEPVIGESIASAPMPTEAQLAEALLDAATCRPTAAEMAAPLAASRPVEMATVSDLIPRTWLTQRRCLQCGSDRGADPGRACTDCGATWEI